MKTLLLPVRAVLAGLLALSATLAGAAAEPALTTTAEATRFAETGRYAEVERLCPAFQRAYPRHARCLEFGRTPEGRPMLAIVASHTGALTPAAARSRGLPVLLAQGGIHAGEIEGKDAGLTALREVLAGRAAPGALDRLVFVFVPVFNVDGHERFGAWNRPNQNGPREMGWRTTAQNLNLNRDYAKADSPEMRAMLGLLGAWDPLVYVDLHTTDGADFQANISVQVEPTLGGAPELRQIGVELRDGVLADLRAAGDIALPFYPSFIRDDDPASGFAVDVAPPRFSHGYWALRNRFGVLVETHSWKPFETRVTSQRNTLYSLIKRTAENGPTWLRAALAADVAAARLGGTIAPVDYDAAAESVTIDFPGYAYEVSPSEISGQQRITYDPSRKVDWRLPLHDRVIATATAAVPTVGYLVPLAEADWVAERLAAHGIDFRRISGPLAGVALSRYQPKAFKFAAAPFEGRTQLQLEGAWTPADESAAHGLLVPIDQPKARLVLALFEPASPDAFVRWGFFNRAFEQKEYMESYVAEQVARDMLARDPALGREFAARLASDPAFAANAVARLDFFYRRHPAWDVRYAVYPVLRVDAAPGG